MTQAHKTPGAVVGFHPEAFVCSGYAEEERSDLFEVMGASHPGHVDVKRLRDGARFLLHDDSLRCLVNAKLAESVRIRHGEVSLEQWQRLALPDELPSRKKVHRSSRP